MRMTASFRSRSRLFAVNLACYANSRPLSSRRSVQSTYSRREENQAYRSVALIGSDVWTVFSPLGDSFRLNPLFSSYIWYRLQPSSGFQSSHMMIHITQQTSIVRRPSFPRILKWSDTPFHSEQNGLSPSSVSQFDRFRCNSVTRWDGCSAAGWIEQ